MQVADVKRLRLGTFVRPVAETGTDETLVVPVYGYLVRHHAGLLLLDTGIGRGDDETEQWYRPIRTDLRAALALADASVDDVTAVVNCHLHFDHCGGNPDFAGRPIFTQRTEYANAVQPDYTFGALVDFRGAQYELLDGSTEIFPGLTLLATPGHTDGHQSLIVQCDDGTVILAGQSQESASDFAAAALAVEARNLGHEPPLPSTPGWLSTLLAYDPARVLFAHDASIWVP